MEAHCETKTSLIVLDGRNITTVAQRVCASLERGELCVIPTDTLYGIVAIDSFEEAVHNIYAIKKRGFEKPFIRLIGKPDVLPLYTKQILPDKLKRYWPGPLTIIFKGLFSETVALRCPDDPFLHELFRLLNYRVLVAPSANVSGQENIYTCNELMRTFRGKVHHIVCLKSETKGTKASTIIDVSRGAWKILREGGLHIDVKELQSDEKRG